MSAGGSKEKLSRLQELLERVQMRAAAARAHGAAEESHAAASPAASASASAPPAYEAPAAQTSPPPAAYNERDEEMSAAPATPAQASVHPAVEPSVYPEAEVDYDVNTDSDVEVSSEVVEVDIDIDEPMPLESGAQPVAQQTMPPEDLEEEVDEQPMATQPSVRPSADEPREEEVAHAAPPANEIEEPTPSSSRRPIAAEEVAGAEAYEPESAPRHTPPPESGKQVAAAPSNHPPSRKPSAPPPSLEGHTLIGGWREPGLGTPQISPSAMGSTGVRVPGPGPAAGRGPSGTEPPATVVQGAGAIAQASGTRLTADVTRPELASGVQIASFTGAPAIEKPKTLGELLDLTLGL
jgi:hypothetical protein